MTEFFRITTETLKKENIEEITKLVDKEEEYQEQRDNWTR